LKPLAGGAVVAFVVVAVVAGAVVALGAVVVAPAFVVVAAPAVVAAADVAPGAVAPGAVAPGVSPGTEADSLGVADSDEPATAATLVPSVAEVVGSVATFATPIV
jgi:hypothetical protein